mmetsp:Transcript_11137/g.29623  ORF Transcript_11137/g.29623 Transcript_11137/m.29623 type:complete len:362 (+) Transcript_11137:118-1203(+)
MCKSGARFVQSPGRSDTLQSHCPGRGRLQRMTCKHSDGRKERRRGSSGRTNKSRTSARHRPRLFCPRRPVRRLPAPASLLAAALQNPICGVAALPTGLLTKQPLLSLNFASAALAASQQRMLPPLPHLAAAVAPLQPLHGQNAAVAEGMEARRIQQEPVLPEGAEGPRRGSTTHLPLAQGRRRLRDALETCVPVALASPRGPASLQRSRHNRGLLAANARHQRYHRLGLCGWCCRYCRHLGWHRCDTRPQPICGERHPRPSIVPPMPQAAVARSIAAHGSCNLMAASGVVALGAAAGRTAVPPRLNHHKGLTQPARRLVERRLCWLATRPDGRRLRQHRPECARHLQPREHAQRPPVVLQG